MRDLGQETLASPVPDLGGIPLEQAAALPPVTLEAMVQRVLPGSRLALSQDAGFSSYI